VWPHLTKHAGFVALAKFLTVAILSASICNPKKLLALLEKCNSVRLPIEPTARYDNE